ncbi:hypothetical protein [Hymenobacter cellulosilyticus]|uniref:hypothetical protein n=1 Tax=Hymenobacter cellulosilyticus TaxID=2932248 RepID=UPI002880863C|nr:hypothetical protein [Hymenobacter cellulosilyticus]
MPFLLAGYERLHPAAGPLPAGLAFGIIGAGALACVGSGYLAQRGARGGRPGWRCGFPGRAVC